MKNKVSRKKSKVGRRLFWLLLLCALAGAGIYFHRQIKSQAIALWRAAGLPGASSPARPPGPEYTFQPVANSQFGWAVRYPDGRVFNLGDEFSGDCTPLLRPAREVRPGGKATLRVEFSEQQSCDPASRKPLHIEASALQDVNGDGSPDLVAAMLIGGNIYGHRASLISLTANGPKSRRLD